MRNKAMATIAAGVVLLIGQISSQADAQDAQPIPLADQLKAQFQLVKTSGYQDAFRVAEPGTVLVVQKAGIVGSPASDLTLLVSKYQDGQLHSPGAFSLGMKKVRRNFDVGDRVYIARLDVNLGKDAISLWLLECAACTGAAPTDAFRADLVFQFAKGSLQKLGVPEVMDAISQVLAFDQNGQAAQNQPPQGQPAQDQSALPQSDQSQAPPAPAQSIQKGQTVDEVVAALGPPQKKVDLGSKQIFIYKDLKVTFKDGRGSDAE